MKRKTLITLVIILAIVLCTIGWLYFKPDRNTYSGFIKTLKQNGYEVKDVTKNYAEKHPQSQDFPNNLKILNVGGEDVFISIETAKTIEGVIDKQLNDYSNPLIDYFRPLYLYRKDNLVVRYFGNNENLLIILETICGEPYTH